MEEDSQDSEDYPCDCLPEMLGDHRRVHGDILGNSQRELQKRIEYVEAKLRYAEKKYAKFKLRVVGDLERIIGNVRGVCDSESEV